MHKRRRILFLLFTLTVLPLLVLALAEVLLRVSGFGYNPDFFTEEVVDGQAVLSENPSFSRTWFPERLTRHPLSFRIPASKDPKTIRIFVLGASAAQGDPHPDFSFARALDVMLNERYPGQTFEVVNVAVTAINSHVVRTIANDCADRSPDLFIVYLGNNEVVGPYGIGTVLTGQFQPLPLIRLSVAVQQLRLGQWLAQLVEPATGGQLPAEWGGLEMFREYTIGWSDPSLERTYRQFKANMEAIVRAGERAGAPVIVSTIVTNYSRQPPFASGQPDLSAAEETELEKLIAALEKAPETVSPQLVSDWLERAPDHAHLHFLAAEQRVGREAYGEAVELFLRSRDLDRLRFRADSRINDIIRGLDDEARPGLWVVDAEEIFRKNSEHGLVGDQWFWEHVHFRPEGNVALARALLPAVEEVLHARGRLGEAPPPDADLSDEAVLQRLALTVHDRMLNAIAMRQRFTSPPLLGQYRNAERVAEVGATVENARQALSRRGEHATVRSAYVSALRHRPDDARIRFQYALFLMAIREPGEALEQMRLALDKAPRNPDLNFKAAQAALMAEAWEIAEERARRCLEVIPNYPRARTYLATALLRQGKEEAALAIAGESLRASPKDVHVRVWLLNYYRGEQQWHEADEAAVALLGMDGTPPPVLYALTDYFLQREQPLLAERARRQALETASTSDEE